MADLSEFGGIADSQNAPQGGTDLSEFGGVKDTAEPEGKSLSGFFRNAGSDINNIVSGVGSLAKGLVTHPIDTTTNLAKNFIPATYNEYETAITHPIEHTYAHPVNTLLDAIPLYSGAKAAGLFGDAAKGAETASEVSQAAKGAETASEVSQAAEGAETASEVSQAAEGAETASEVSQAAEGAEKGADVSGAASKARPPVGSIIGGSDMPVAKDFVPTEERVANSAYAQAIGGTPKQFLKEYGTKNPEKALTQSRQWAATADNGQPLSKFFDRPGEMLDKVENITHSAGKTCGDLLKEADTEPINKQLVIDDLKGFAKRTADPHTKARINNLVKTANDLSGDSVSDLKVIQQIKQMAGDELRKDSGMIPVYGHLSRSIEDVMDDYAKSINDPNKLAQYLKAKNDYANGSRLIGMLRYSEWKNLVGGPAGHETLRGMVGNLTDKIGELATGTTPNQILKNAMFQAVSPQDIPIASKIPVVGKMLPRPSPLGVVAGIVKGAKHGLPWAEYSGLVDALEKKYGGLK